MKREAYYLYFKYKAQKLNKLNNFKGKNNVNSELDIILIVKFKIKCRFTFWKRVNFTEILKLKCAYVPLHLYSYDAKV